MSNIFLLRPYQSNIIDRVQDVWSSGKKNVMVQLATGGGKTIIFCEILKKFSGNSVLIAHRTEILAQISLVLAKNRIQHDIIGNEALKSQCRSLHLKEIGSVFYSKNTKKVVIASVDTLKKHEVCMSVSLVIVDEAHHALKNNKWGKAISLFPNAKVLMVTATPVRCDGKGLSITSDGFAEELICGKPMLELIQEGYLSDYKIYAPKNNLDLSKIKLASDGDFSKKDMSQKLKESTLTGDVVHHYKKFANGQQGLTFCINVEAALEIANSYNKNGVRAEVLTAKTQPFLRNGILSMFRKGEIKQLVSVDILGEGFDVPSVSVVSFARPTMSYAVYAQQFGRALRVMDGKEHAIIIDHVGNVMRHGLPDLKIRWTLDPNERSSNRKTSNNVKVCLECFRVFLGVKELCPFCRKPIISNGRELSIIDEELEEVNLDHIRKQIEKIDGPLYIPKNLNEFAKISLMKKHQERRKAQIALRNQISVWAAKEKKKGLSDSQIMYTFENLYGISIAEAQTLGCKQANELEKKLWT